MTKSTITRERLEEIVSDPMINQGSEFAMMARMALAAMDSEPVAWTDEEELRDVNVAGIGYLFGIDREANKFADPRRQIMLYRHAQPAPVVLRISDEMTSEQAYEIGDYHGDPVDVFVRGANWMRQHIIDSTLAAAPQEDKP